MMERLVDMWPILVWMVVFVWWIRKANARSVESARINNALLQANQEMVERLRNIEALIEKNRQA